ncbi:MAG: thioredoxin domain-containing protein [Bifidobacteriaceae bacterium]|jgi:protein-disulfide isomerase|nr:thioredoxin domain-containing protein [Bifidobacteriaceae bacterium]
MTEPSHGPSGPSLQIDPPARGFVPWYKQAGAWVVIGGVAVAFSAALVITAGSGADRTASDPASSPSDNATASQSPNDGDGAAASPGVEGDFAPVAAAACPEADGTPAALAGQPAGATELGGIALGCDGTPGGPVAPETAVTVEVMSDYICPFCQRFEDEVGPQLDQAVRAGQVKLTVYPMGYLDVYSTSEYSSRAARAAVAVAGLDPRHFEAFDQLLWDNQPAEGGPGLSDEEIAGLARQAGVSEDAITQFTSGAYDAWVAQTTAAVSGSEGFQGTPWVLIGDGTSLYQWDWSGGDLQTAIAKVAAGQQP